MDKQPGMAAWIYIHNTGEVETGRSLGSLATQSSQLGALLANEKPYFKTQGGWLLRKFH